MTSTPSNNTARVLRLALASYALVGAASLAAGPARFWGLFGVAEPATARGLNYLYEFGGLLTGTGCYHLVVSRDPELVKALAPRRAVVELALSTPMMMLVFMGALPKPTLVFGLAQLVSALGHAWSSDADAAPAARSSAGKPRTALFESVGDMLQRAYYLTGLSIGLTMIFAPAAWAQFDLGTGLADADQAPLRMMGLTVYHLGLMGANFLVNREQYRNVNKSLRRAISVQFGVAAVCGVLNSMRADAPTDAFKWVVIDGIMAAVGLL